MKLSVNYKQPLPVNDATAINVKSFLKSHEEMFEEDDENEVLKAVVQRTIAIMKVFINGKWTQLVHGCGVKRYGQIASVCACGLLWS